MPYLIASVVLVGVLCVLNLFLTVGIVRRMREYTRMLSSFNGAAEPMLPSGAVVGEFITSTVDGEPISRASLDDTLVGFFSTGCPSCTEKLPSFVASAEGTAGGRSHVLAVVVGSDSATGKFVTALSPVAQVVVEPEGGPVSTAFEVKSFPAVGVVGAGGVVVASGAQIRPLAETATT